MTQFLTTIPSRRPVWCRAALWLFGCALALPVAADQTPPPAELPEPLALLAGLTDAARQHAYRGTIVMIQGGAPVSIAVEHRLLDKGSELHYMALDGVPYGMQLHYADRDCQLFGDPIARLTQPAGSGALAVLPMDEYYRLESLGLQRVADRFVYALMALPEDGKRHARRLFIDVKTGILLRSEYLSAQGQLLASSQFIAFSEQADSDRAALADNDRQVAVQPPAVQRCDSAADQLERVAAAEASAWRLGWWPVGFALNDYRRDAAGLESFMFSDGLAQFTLFVDTANHLPVDSIGGSRGATSAVIRHLRSDAGAVATVSVVGEVPRSTAEQILAAVQLVPSAGASR